MNDIKRARIVHISKNFAEAEAWDIRQQLEMTPEERQKVAYELRKRVYGNDCPDVKEAQRIKERRRLKKQIKKEKGLKK